MVKYPPVKNSAILPPLRSTFPNGLGVLDGIGVSSRPQEESGLIQDKMPGRDSSALGECQETKEQPGGVQGSELGIGAKGDRSDESRRCIRGSCGSGLQPC